MMRVERRVRFKVLAVPLALAAILLIGTDESHAVAGVCVSAVIDEPFLLPDGSVHPSGRLTLCGRHDYTPVLSFHTTFVDRRPIGVFTSRRETAPEAPADGYYVIFSRGPNRPLRLVGYAVPHQGSVEAYFLERPRVRVNDSLQASPAPAPAASAQALVRFTAYAD